MMDAPKKAQRPVHIEDWIDQDLTLAAQAGRLPPAFHRGDLVQQVEEVLSAVPARSPVVTGAPGVGKSAVIYELVRRAVAGKGPALLREHRVLQLSFRNLSSHFPKPQLAAGLVRRLFDKLRDEGVVVFIRDVHLAYQLDWEPILYRYLCRSGRPLLGEGTTKDVQLLIDGSSDLAEHLVQVPMEEPRVPEVKSLVRQWSEWQAARSGRVITPDAQRIAVELTGRFLGDRPFPRKVLDLLSQTRDVTPPVGDDESTAAITLLDVVERFSATSRVPSALVNPHVHLDLEQLRSFLAERLLGQQEAAEAVVRMVALIKSGLSDLTRPFGVFLFVGPTGVGKTHTAQLLAEYLFGDRDRMVRLNMPDFAGEGSNLLLFGNPGSYRLDERMGVLAARLRGHPFGVLLLDEFEKTHPKVHDAFMQLLDEGRYINGNGDVVSVTSLIVIATSNAGAEVYRETGLGFRQELDLAALDAELDRRLHRVFRFEFLNRFDRVVHFHPLDRANIRAIAGRDLARLLERDGLVGRRLEVEVDPEVVEWLAAHGYHPHYGARFLRREIERHITAALADVIVREHPGAGSRLHLGVRGDRVYARLVREHTERAVVRLPEEGREVELDLDELLAQARVWVERWQPLLLESAARRDAASLLITESSAPGFWNDVEHAREVLRRHRSLEARIQSDERLSAPPRRLQRHLEEQRLPTLENLGRLVEESAENYRRWLDLGTEEGPDGAWVVLSPGDPLAPAPEFVLALVELYLAWFRRKGLTAEVIAEEDVNGVLHRAVLEVEGGGVLGIAEMEHGRHRRRLPNGDLERVTVEVLPRRPTPQPHEHALVEAAKKSKGILVERRTARLRLDLVRRGLQVALVGTDRETLVHLGGDLAAAWASAASELDVARTYGVVGGTVRDPRTEASVASIKDVFRGNLDAFLAAWRKS